MCYLLDNEKSLDLALKEGLQILENFSKEEKGELTVIIIFTARMYIK